jgi:hypothetical protein
VADEPASVVIPDAAATVPKPTPDIVAPIQTIGELLGLSRAAHARYRGALGRKGSASGALIDLPGDPVGAAGALLEAAKLRKRAELLDPTHADDAWVIDADATGGSASLMTFYAEHLGRADHPVAAAARRIAEKEG